MIGFCRQRLITLLAWAAAWFRLGQGSSLGMTRCTFFRVSPFAALKAKPSCVKTKALLHPLRWMAILAKSRLLWLTRKVSRSDTVSQYGTTNQADFIRLSAEL